MVARGLKGFVFVAKGFEPRSGTPFVPLGLPNGFGLFVEKGFAEVGLAIIDTGLGRPWALPLGVKGFTVANGCVYPGCDCM